MTASSTEPGVGRNVTRLREARGWSQAELARRAGMDPGHISRIEDGTFVSPRLPNLRKLAKALEVDLGAITGKEEPYKRLTPYDRSPAIRRFVDALVDLTPEERRLWERMHALFGEALREASGIEAIGLETSQSLSTAPEIEPSSERTTTQSTEAQRLAAAVLRLDDQARAKFFDAMASADAFATTKLDRIRTRNE